LVFKTQIGLLGNGIKGIFDREGGAFYEKFCGELKLSIGNSYTGRGKSSNRSGENRIFF
jgi:hypothetical protein